MAYRKLGGVKELRKFWHRKKVLKGDFPKKKPKNLSALCYKKEVLGKKGKKMEDVLIICSTSGFEGFIYSQLFMMRIMQSLSFVSYSRTFTEYLQN